MSDEAFNDKKFLQARKFPLGGCHMKKSNPSGGWPLAYGIMFPNDLSRIFLLDKNMVRSGEEAKYDSIDALLADGWIVD